ncbi:hypothetical protein JHK85_032793 [Glycine max]|uniref:Uncharacterized protein n=2 Tax=Glycine subgen. Soja TaxID=1462606 RepID=K7LRQ6_SOYBN|nr:hypothetical protein JHK85_032793 [Glycine max]KAH1160417.1 hypothetical protein GYH30_031948 [Glycine max]KHN34726.1 hypothetical protein glysoja_039022 [Glycine soja]RZB72989.1 hypothetical protein D0Y65_036963 [Glycine soja]
MEFAKPATIGRNNETPAIHTAVRMACDGREWRCHFCGLDRGEELYGGEDGITERESLSMATWCAGGSLTTD